jgi:hypothetical protein
MVRVSDPALKCILACIIVLCFLASPIHSNAQAGSQAPAADANDDLIKMISAGLPESVVIAKIRDNAGRWDTSVDALIVLKRAGASEAEFAALAAGPQAGINLSQPMATSFMGGAIRKTLSGDPMLSFPPDLPTRFLDTRPTNTAFLVNYKGSPSILVPAIRFIPNCCYAVTNVLFLHDKLVFDFYVWEKIGTREASGFSKITNPKMFPEAGNPLPLELTRTGLLLQPNQIAPCRVEARTDSKIKEPEVTFDRLVRTGAGQNCSFDFSMMFGTFVPGDGVYAVEQMRSPGLSAFVGKLMSDYDSVLAGWLRAVRITDPATQLSADANYTPVTDADQERYEAEAKDLQQPPAGAPKSGGGLGKLIGLGKKAGAASGAAPPAAPAAPQAPQAPQMPQAPQAPPPPQVNAAGAPGAPPPAAQAGQPAAPGSGSAPAEGSAAQTAYAGQPASTASGGESASGYGAAAGPGSASAGPGGSAPGSSSNAGTQKKYPPRTACMEPTAPIYLDSNWTDASKQEVVGYFANPNSDYVSCVYSFHKAGRWDMKNASTIVLGAGVKRRGGEDDGVWDKGDDSSNIKYQCYNGTMPVDANGDDCLGSVVFTGPPDPGTEK